METEEKKIESKSSECSEWLDKIDAALENEKDWRKDGEQVFKIYRSQSKSKTKKDKFNILWSNTEIKRQSLINATPIPDIRRRYNDPDPIGKEACEVLKRAISYTLDCQEGLNKLILAANDMLLPGRGLIRVRYKGYMTEADDVDEPVDTDEQETDEEKVPEVTYEECQLEHVKWDKFIHSHGDEWADVEKEGWVGFIHEVEKDEAKERWPNHYAKLSYETAEKKKKGPKDKSEIKVATVYEIWDKDDKVVRWIGKDYSDDFLEVIDDPMELRNFFPIPRPVYAVEDSASLCPIIEYSQYETLAKELEDLTNRIGRLVSAIRVRGGYDSRLSELQQIFEEDDNEFIALKNATAVLENGGLEKSIFFLPIQQLVGSVQVLNEQRMLIKQQIEEITGMSDIIRGASNPHETATAQRIKANFASARLDRQKQAFQIFARDLIRLIADVVSQFSRDTISVMTGLTYQTEQEKQMMQMQVQQMQQQMQMMQPPQIPGQPPAQPDPQMQQQIQQIQQQMQQMQAELSKPSWEQVSAVLMSDMTREYQIDIETDSTIAADKQAQQETLSTFMQAIAQFTTMAANGQQAGVLTNSASKEMLKEFVRGFGLSKNIEEALDKQDPPRENPEAQKVQAEMQMKQQEHQMQMQAEQQKNQMEMQKMQLELQVAQQEAQIEMQKMQAELEIERQKLAMEREKVAMQQQSLQMKAQYEAQNHMMKMQEGSNVTQ